MNRHLLKGTKRKMNIFSQLKKNLRTTKSTHERAACVGNNMCKMKQ